MEFQEIQTQVSLFSEFSCCAELSRCSEISRCSELTFLLDSLRTYFGQFGEVRDVDIKIDMATQQSRGFGFVLFADPASISAVEAAGEHNLGEFSRYGSFLKFCFRWKTYRSKTGREAQCKDLLRWFEIGF